MKRLYQFVEIMLAAGIGFFVACGLFWAWFTQFANGWEDIAGECLIVACIVFCANLLTKARTREKREREK